MTTINATIPFDPPTPRGAPVDDFVARLSDPTPGHASGAFVTFIESIVSFGLLPLLLWPLRWAEYLESERGDLVDLAAWWRQRIDADHAVKLDKIASRLRPRPMLMVLPWLAVGFNVVFLGTVLIMGGNVHRLVELTFGHRTVGMVGSPLQELESHVYLSWVLTVGLAYLCQWSAVKSHATAVKSLVKWTNALAKENRFTTIPNVEFRAGLNPLWVIGAILLCGAHAWWAIPMVGAGAAQRTYVRKYSPTIRRSLASQARSGYAIVRSRRDRFCTTDHCGIRLPPPAKFCPRCGTAVA